MTKATESWLLIEPYAQRMLDEALGVTDGGSRRGAEGEYPILLYDGNEIIEFPFTSTGFAAAIAAISSTDVIFYPAGTIGGNHTISTGTVRGLARDRSILSGAITVSGGTLDSMTVNGSESAQVTLSSGLILNCHIETSDDTALNQSGGDCLYTKIIGQDNGGAAAYIVSGASSGNTLNIRGSGVSCSINAANSLLYCTSLVDDTDPAFLIVSGNLVYCQATASGTGLGFVKTGAGTATLIQSHAICASGNELEVAAGGTLEVYAVEYDSSQIDGTLTYMAGDRSAFSVEDYHAEDIEDSALTRHLPAPGTDGNRVRDNGTNWVSVANIWEPLTNGDGDNPGLIFDENGDVIMVEVIY